VKRNLLYHVYPLRNSIWKWNIDLLNRHASIFNGRVIISIAIDESTDHFKEVISLIKIPNAEIVVVKNDPNRAEGVTFLPALGELASDNPDEATFYAHAKGVARSIKRPYETENVKAWVECMWHANTASVELIELALKDYACAGCFQRFGQHGGGSWHFGGTFYWVKHSEIFKGNWKDIDPGYYGVEGWIGRQVAKEKAFCIFNLLLKDLYQKKILPYEYERAPKMALADLQLEHEETATGKRD